MNLLTNPKQSGHTHQRWYRLIADGIRYIAPDNASALRAFVVLLVAFFATSCVHEWPEPECDEAFDLELKFDTEFTVRDFTYTRGENPEMTYIVHAYTMIDGNVKRDNYREFTLTRDISGGYDCKIQLDLLPGDYRVMVWAMFRHDGRYYYDADDFAAVTLTEPYVGDTDYRDAFRGSLDITVSANQGGSSLTQSGTIMMGRPMAKFEFVSTDVRQFIEDEIEVAGPEFNYDDYYSVFTYPQFMPSSYNMFNGRPNDSWTGVKFEAALKPFGPRSAKPAEKKFSELTNEDEVSLGFDYVFVNGSEAYVTVQVSVYRKSDDTLVASTPQVRVPIQRDYHTIVRGNFLLTNTDGGIGIDPGYDGEFVVVAPLVPEY